MPDKLYAAFFHQVEVLEYTLVDGSCAKAATYEQDGLLFRVETELLACFFRGDGSFQYILANRITGHDNLVCREETLHSFVSHTDLFSLLGQEFIGYTSV